MERLDGREGWLLLIAPLSTAVVWAGGIAAGNVGWISGWGTRAPVGAIFALTTCTFFLYLLSLPILVRLLKRWRRGRRAVGFRLVLSGLATGSAWGLMLKGIGPAFAIQGHACGLVVGLLLAIALRRRDQRR
ncbi:hypothetical protein [Paraburkholderia bannensis]|uniref:hypothetical protein n=1 Tax=Paraburkholderia bannensis TaxID=765414 RepID=UPI002ABD4FFC|nr:hypothetical protein [Paraburkholderia bannensis]